MATVVTDFLSKSKPVTGSHGENKIAGHQAWATPYSHAEHIGNRADVVKHAALLAAVSYIVYKEKPRPFVYAESHAGSPTYKLAKGGSWRFGMGEITQRLLGAAGSKERWPALNPYRVLALRTPINVGTVVRGSHELVYQMLRGAGEDVRMYLWDTSARVDAELRLHHRTSLRVQHFHADGVQGLRKLAGTTLALIDSPRMDIDSLAAVIADRLRKGGHFVLWTPRLGGDLGEDLATQEFRNLVREQGLHVGTTQWRRWESGAMCGCQLIASAALSDPISAVLNDVHGAMEWIS